MRKYNFSGIALYGLGNEKSISLCRSLITITALSLVVGLGLFVMQPKTVLIWSLIAESNGLVFLLNWLPVWLVMLFLFFSTGNLVIACGLGALIFFVPAFFNRYMIAMRLAPLRPFDLRLGMEFLGVTKSIRPAVLVALCGGIVFLITATAVGIRFVKNNRPSVVVRVAAALVCVVTMCVLFVTVYDSRALYERLPLEGSAYNEADQYQSKGFVYSFLYTWRNSRLSKPDYFDRFKGGIEAAESQAHTPPVPDTLPNIVMILSEAFSELAFSDAVDFAGHDDPLYFYRQIKRESVSGYLVAPHIGGGTADIEFDILTGINTRDFRGVPYSFAMVTQPFPGFVDVLATVGYEALALHPGAGWFYNRQNVYPFLGFGGFADHDHFDKRDTKGGYISEAHTLDTLIRYYENRPSDPFFLKLLTIQNHGSYRGKYGAAQNFNLNGELSAHDVDELANYFHGLMDNDIGLKRLVDYFSAASEPVVLVYYGDHMPSLSLEVYQTLIPEADYVGGNLIRFNRVPFLIWANDAAKPLLDSRAFEASLPTDQTISAHYLGAAVLDMLGLAQVDAYMAFLNELRLEYPVTLESTYRHSGSDFIVFDPDEADDLARFKSWGYYRITSPRVRR